MKCRAKGIGDAADIEVVRFERDVEKTFACLRGISHA